MQRVALLLACVSICACTAETSSNEPGGRATAVWRGTVESNDSCIGGDLFLLVESEEGTAWSGTAYYESVPFQGERYRATYTVQGALEEGTLHLRETEISEADDGGEVMDWCMGDYRLRVDGAGEVGGSPLVGEYEPTDCDCAAAPVSLAPEK